jgi:hypothetical protein
MNILQLFKWFFIDQFTLYGGGGGGDGGKGGGDGGGKGGVTQVVTIGFGIAASIVAGPEIGAAIYESMGTTAAAVGVSEATVGAAAISGASSSVNAAVQGKDVEGILEAGAIGAASGAVGAEASSAVSGATADTLGKTGAAVAGGAARGSTSGFTKAELSGKNLDQALKSAEIGGITGAVAGGISEGVQGLGGSESDARLVNALAGPFVSQNVSNLFSPQTSSSTTASRTRGTPEYDATGGPGGPGGPSGPSTQQVGNAPTTGQVSPGSAALGQALRIGDPGAPIESPGGGESSRQPVWNQASLRNKDETGS